MKKLVPLGLALGLLGVVMTGPTPVQAAPLSSGLAAIADAQPDDIIQVQRRRGGGAARVGRGGGRYVGRRHYHGGYGAAAVGTGLAIGILGAAAASAAAPPPPQCRYRDPVTRERYWGPC